MDYSYSVSTIQSTIVNFSLSCRLFSAEILNLILIKGNILEIYSLTKNGLILIYQSNFFGSILSLEKYSSGDFQFDLIFILTEKKNFCIFSYNNEINSLILRAKGNVKDQVGKPLEQGVKGMIDPDNKVIGMMLYDGLFKVSITFNSLPLLPLSFFPYENLLYFLLIFPSI